MGLRPKGCFSCGTVAGTKLMLPPSVTRARVLETNGLGLPRHQNSKGSFCHLNISHRRCYMLASDGDHKEKEKYVRITCCTEGVEQCFMRVVSGNGTYQEPPPASKLTSQSVQKSAPASMLRSSAVISTFSVKGPVNIGEGRIHDTIQCQQR